MIMIIKILEATIFIIKKFDLKDAGEACKGNVEMDYMEGIWERYIPISIEFLLYSLQISTHS